MSEYDKNNIVKNKQKKFIEIYNITTILYVLAHQGLLDETQAQPFVQYLVRYSAGGGPFGTQAQETVGESLGEWCDVRGISGGPSIGPP